MAIALVIAFGIPGSGAVSERASTSISLPLTARSETCPDARRAIAYYRQRAADWRKMRGSSTTSRGRSPRNCPDARYLAGVWRIRARNARVEYQEWHAYHYAWWKWLPPKWQRIGACETGYGRIPGNWQHSNSSYEGAFGFAKSSWDAFKGQAAAKARPYPEDAWQATPRQQYEVALAIWRRYGFSGWGCRGA